MNGGKLTVRIATFDDARLLWEWSNDRTVRDRSFNPEPISWQSHIEWFKKRLDSPETIFYILVNDDSPVGQIRYDKRHGEDAAEISFSIDEAHRGKGFGAEILRQTVGRAIADLNVREIKALVILGNASSKRAFLSAGFETWGTFTKNDLSAEEFVWRPSTSSEYE